MTVSAIGATSTQSSDKATTATPQLELNQDAFLKLLLTQLQYQDPLSPMEDREFITQLAQFTSLSEMQKLNESMTQMLTAQSLSSATDLIGKTVSGLSATGGSVSGVAEAALLRDGTVYLKVSGAEVELSTILEVSLGGSGGPADQ